MNCHLESDRYGKHTVRVSKVRRPRNQGEQHEFVEVAVDVELEGEFAAAFTKADNRSVIATDTCKNIIYVLAKDHPLDTIESFGLAISQHFLSHYEHVSRCLISLRERTWSRLYDSPHCFTARDTSIPTAKIRFKRGELPQVTAGLEHLLIAKTTESGFSNFHSDEFRTLADTDERVFAPELSANWDFATADVDFLTCRNDITKAMLTRFTDHFSHSVQETLYLMGKAALAACAPTSRITLSMLNLHHIRFDLSPFGRDNDNEVFAVTNEPYGYIEGTIVRD